jgi:hypothetical protein
VLGWTVTAEDGTLLQQGMDDGRRSADAEEESSDGWSTFDENEAFSGSEEAEATVAFELSCSACTQLISRRAVHVYLCADATKELYSLDVPLEGAVTEEGVPYTIDSCSCTVRTTACSNCRTEVGYHVVGACVFCSELSDNNTHYWMFNGAVAAAPTSQLYYKLPMNHRPFDEPCVPAAPALAARVPVPAMPAPAAPTPASATAPALLPPPTSASDQLGCIICGDVYYNPVSIMCTNPPHIFCRVCIARHIDAKHACPFDRNPLTLESPTPSVETQVQLDGLSIRCRYGCQQADDGSWGGMNEGEGCPTVVMMGRRVDHEATCVFGVQVVASPSAADGTACAISRVASSSAHSGR